MKPERFAMTVPIPDGVAVLEHGGWWWPFRDKEQAREIAKETGQFGVWMRKR